MAAKRLIRKEIGLFTFYDQINKSISVNVLKCFPYSQKLFSKRISVLKRPLEIETGIKKNTGITFYCLFSALPRHSNQTTVEYNVLYNIRGIKKYI